MTSRGWRTRDIPKSSVLNISTKYIPDVIFSVLVHQKKFCISWFQDRAKKSKNHNTFYFGPINAWLVPSKLGPFLMIFGNSFLSMINISCYYSIFMLKYLCCFSKCKVCNAIRFFLDLASIQKIHLVLSLMVPAEWLNYDFFSISCQ